jgi:hypothetical protein
MLQKFIGRVEAGTESVKVHWIVDRDHYDRELALKKADSRSSGRGPSENLKDFSSYTLTIGAPSQT